MNNPRILLTASGDARLPANQLCQPTQARMEAELISAFEACGAQMERLDPVTQHGFLDSQKRCLEVFRDIDKDAPLVIAESVLQYSHQPPFSPCIPPKFVLHGLSARSKFLAVGIKAD